MCTKVLSVEDGSMKNRDKKCQNPHLNTKFFAKLRRKTKSFQKVSALFSLFRSIFSNYSHTQPQKEYFFL